MFIKKKFFFLQNEKVAVTIFYEMEWYKFDMKNRKLLLIFHSQVQRSFDLLAFSIFKASLFIFALLMRKLYSFIHILRSTLVT